MLGLNWDSSVGIVTGIWITCLKSRDSVPNMGTTLFSPPERPARPCDPPSLLFSGYFGLFTGGGLAEKSEYDRWLPPIPVLRMRWARPPLSHALYDECKDQLSSRTVPIVFCACASYCTSPPRHLLYIHTYLFIIIYVIINYIYLNFLRFIFAPTRSVKPKMSDKKKYSILTNCWDPQLQPTMYLPLHL